MNQGLNISMADVVVHQAAEIVSLKVQLQQARDMLVQQAQATPPPVEPVDEPTE